MRTLSRSAWTAWRDVLKWAPAEWWALIGLSVLIAALPAVQVFAFRFLGDAVSGNGSLPGAIAVVTLVAGGYLPLQGLAGACADRMKFKLRAAYQDELVEMLAKLTRTQRTDPKLADKLQTTSDAIPFNLAWQANSSLLLVRSVVTAVFLCLAIASTDLLAAFAALLGLLPAFVAHSVIAGKENELWPLQSAAARRAEYFSDQLKYSRSGNELADLHATDQFADWFREKNHQVCAYWLDLANHRLKAEMLSAAASLLLLAVALCSIIFRAQADPVEIAGITLGIVSGMLATQNSGAAYGEFMASAPLVLAHDELRSQLLDQAPLPPAPQRATGQALNCTDVRFGYAADKSVLRGVNLRCEPGNITALTGSNGAGKTTLLNLIMGSLEPDAGTITGPSGPQIAKLDQDFGKYELTIRQYLTLGAGSELSDAQIWDALQIVEADQLVRSCEAGLDTQLGQQWGGLDFSGGEWQRLAIARTLLRPAPLLLLDEPTSAIDADSDYRIIRNLNQRLDARTVLLVSHRPATLAQVETVYHLQDGQAVQR